MRGSSRALQRGQSLPHAAIGSTSEQAWHDTAGPAGGAGSGNNARHTAASSISARVSSAATVAAAMNSAPAPTFRSNRACSRP